MSDLRTMMFQAAGPLPAATEVRIADQDLARARQALRKRRVGRIGASSGLVAVAAVGAFVIAVPSLLPGSASSPSGTAAGTTAAGTTGSSGTRVGGTALVSYTGKQPTGYTLDKIPAGWEINSNNTGALLLAPEGFTEEKLPTGMVSLQGKIAVRQEGAAGFPPGVPMDKVQVGKRPGVIAHMKGGGDTRTLFVKQPSGNYLAIQVWSGLGWSNDRIVEFATGVHITKDAQVSQG
jgi:hypothetical protein